jgi:hypothetical protein
VFEPTITAMTDSNDADRDKQPAGDAPKETRSSGRVAFDSRGNPIWEWQLETGVYSRDVSTQKLKKLDLGDLSIAESAIQKQPAGLKEALGGSQDPGNKSKSSGSAKAHAPQVGGGFNPYDNSARAGPASNPYDHARALAKQRQDAAAQPPSRSPPKPAVRRPAPPPPKKESMLSRLDQWFKDKRRSKDDDEYE